MLDAVPNYGYSFSMPFTIRPERETDFHSIGELVEESFLNIAESDGDERDFVTRMRHHPGYIPGLALVAEKAGILSGYVMLTRTAIEGDGGGMPVLLLAPLCVPPRKQGRGIGGRLLREAFVRAASLGYGAIFLAGNPRYYGRFGFRPAVAFGIGHSMPVADKYILARELVADALAGRGGTIVLTGHTSCGTAVHSPIRRQTVSRDVQRGASCRI